MRLQGRWNLYWVDTWTRSLFCLGHKLTPYPDRRVVNRRHTSIKIWQRNAMDLGLLPTEGDAHVVTPTFSGS